MKFYLKTYGCQMNVHDSEKIAGILSEQGYDRTTSVKDAGVVVLNTCNIRQKAEQKFYSELGRLEMIKKNNPHMRIAVAGCIAQQTGSGVFKRFPHVDFVFGPGNIDRLETWLYNGGQKTEVSGQRTAVKENPENCTKNLPIKREGRVKAWVSIMYGCDNYCSYCVVPYTRGREKSRPRADILREVESLGREGYKEITLLGQNVNSYGKNLVETIYFSQLLKVLHEVNGIERIRFVTSHPRDLSPDLITTMRDLPKVCDHLHLPLQSGSDRILRLMNRGYTYETYREKIDMVRQAMPDIAVTTDIIVGFPGETAEDFNHTLSAMKDLEFDGIYAFKYSPRPDTAALSLSHHVEEHLKSERLTMVLDLQDTITLEKNRLLEGRTFEVLVEGPSVTDRDRLTGRTKTNKIVNFCGHGEDIGRTVSVRVLEAKRHSLLGEKI